MSSLAERTEATASLPSAAYSVAAVRTGRGASLRSAPVAADRVSADVEEDHVRAGRKLLEERFLSGQVP